MVLRPLRRAPFMLGGVGFQAGLDEAHRKQLDAARASAAEPDLVAQLKELQALQSSGALSPEEFEQAKRAVLNR